MEFKRSAGITKPDLMGNQKVFKIHSQESGVPLPWCVQHDCLCGFLGMCVCVSLGFGDICGLSESLLQTSPAQSMCSGQCLSAKNGSLVAELLCSGLPPALSKEGEWSSWS